MGDWVIGPLGQLGVSLTRHGVTLTPCQSSPIMEKCQKKCKYEDGIIKSSSELHQRL